LDISQEPGVSRWYERLASLGRLVTYDQRGAGVSDPVPVNDLPTVERVAEDMEAVLTAAGSERCVIVATTSLGPAAMLLAATKPDLVSSLVLYGTYARMRAAPDYPAGVPSDVLDRFVDLSREDWGTGAMLRILAPSRAKDPAYLELFARVEKLSISPTQSAILGRMGTESDVRHVLGSITAPTLVIHRTGDRFVGAAHGRYLADHIPNATYAELDGDDHALYAGDVDALLDEIEQFITGERARPVPNRVLATVLFTDIVNSTGLASQLGDQQWKGLLDRHDQVAHRQVDRFGGRMVKTTGDGLLATFDGPARAVLCACAIRDGVKVLGVDTRSGVHTGEVEMRGEDIGGIGVHIAARVVDKAGPGQVWASRTVRDLSTGSGITFESTGAHELRGVVEPWELFQVVG
jgi:class 3 adenylate cyclase